MKEYIALDSHKHYSLLERWNAARRIHEAARRLGWRVVTVNSTRRA